MRKCEKKERSKKEQEELTVILQETVKKYCWKKSRQNARNDEPVLRGPAVDPISIWTIQDGPETAGGLSSHSSLRGPDLYTRYAWVIAGYNNGGGHVIVTSPQSQQLGDFNPGSPNFHNHDEVCSFWAMASKRFTPFQPLWDWVLDLLQNSCFAKHFVFDAQHLYKFNGEHFMHFFDEPWTANSFWEAQSRLPLDAKPLAFILYADKSKLSSFGTQKGYLIVARIANLPVEIRNGTGMAGGRVVDKDKMQSGNQSFMNFKNAVWHKSFFLLLEAVIQHSKTGYWLDCGDMIRRFLWPLILILSADYEEQCVMALIFGLKGKFPCPICLVPQDMQAVFSVEHVLRTSAQSQQTLEIARAASTKKARAASTKKSREAHLKAFSLRDVECVFWVWFCDVHRTLSWDHLHASGLWSDHLWEELHFWLAEFGREAASEIDAKFILILNLPSSFYNMIYYMDVLPRWPNLRHFMHVIKIDFSDGSVHEDISRMIIFADQNILTTTESENCYLLLQCIRLFIKFDMYALLEVHTEDTIATGRETLHKFVVLLDHPKIHHVVMHDARISMYFYFVL
ncbi:hypothetical protein DEU56DRAFT_755019 [Suillus clintonianus]|uniref:uncharacterized protein n=1 Tax=Suillus clintonianus TaxID=1904413 RepID=UPI001B882AD4|nr:uncharacterized protein DEU56DRAFT_755019 [Suillus clintonianus]KAG2141316.1 hypothetical protein DEU56DRAFT_755019 [Suillus clintonianus]